MECFNNVSCIASGKGKTEQDRASGKGKTFLRGWKRPEKTWQDEVSIPEPLLNYWRTGYETHLRHLGFYSASILFHCWRPERSYLECTWKRRHWMVFCTKNVPLVVLDMLFRLNANIPGRKLPPRFKVFSRQKWKVISLLENIIGLVSMKRGKFNVIIQRKMKYELYKSYDRFI